MQLIKILSAGAVLIGVLAISCSENGTVVEPNNDPLISVSKTEINLSGNSFADRIEIINAGGGQLQWDIQEKPDWVDVSALVGTLTDDADTVRISTRFDLLEYGTYEGTVKINSNGGVISIILKLVYAPPKLKIENPVINMDRHYSRADLVIINEGGGELSWQITEAPAWVEFQVTEGMVKAFPQYVPFQIRFSSLDYGFYESKVKIESNGGALELSIFFIYEREIEVYPGDGAAYISLGQTYSAVQSQWGTPDKNWYDRPEKTLFIHHFTYDDVGLHFAVKTNSLILYGSGKVGYIEVVPPYDGMTEGLIGIGSTTDELKAAHGEPTSISGSEWYYEAGIIFIIRSNKINGMIIKENGF